MTDNEIIKALERCSMFGTIDCCGGCPFGGNTVRNCVDDLLLAAICLINRQNAKIEALQMDNAQIQSDNINTNMNFEHLQAEIERLKGWQDLLKSEKHSLIKAGAIKEFQIELRKE